MSQQAAHEGFNLVWSFRWRGRGLTVRFNQWMTAVVAVLVPLLATWYLGATLYYVFHDQLLASLLARQTDQQYSYEDRIAVLKTQLDRETSRGLLDQRTLATTMSDLLARGSQLEARAAQLDQLLDQTMRTQATAGAAFERSAAAVAPKPDPALSGSLNSGVSLKPLEPALRLDRARRTSELGPADGGSVGVEAQARMLTDRFASLGERQDRAIARARQPIERSVQVMQAALAQIGVPYPRSGRSGSVPFEGGPFVPLPATAALDFETNVALLKGAIDEQAKLGAVIATVPLRRPLIGPMEVTSTFGARVDPFYGRPAMHTGIDLLEASGDAVVATAAGVVTVAGSEGGYGNMVEIDHGNGLATRYAHMSAIEVVPHQKIAAGTVVGRVGSTGRATGPHLHYETRINGEAVDPSRFLRAGAGLFPG